MCDENKTIAIALKKKTINMDFISNGKFVAVNITTHRHMTYGTFLTNEQYKNCYTQHSYNLLLVKDNNVRFYRITRLGLNTICTFVFDSSAEKRLFTCTLYNI